MPSIAYAVLHVALSICIPSTNLLVIIVICQLKKKRPSRNYVFILNLAAADLLVGVMCIGDALDDATDALFDTRLSLCLLRICMSITPCIGSILTLLLVSLDRYLAVRLPLHYHTLMNKKRIIFSLVVLWTVAFLVGHLPLISPQLQQSNYTGGQCGLLSAAQNEYLYIICFGIFVPALLTLVCLHIAVGRIAYLQHKQIQRAYLRADTFIAHLRHFKALRTVLIMIICFIVFWGPYYLTAIVKAICTSCTVAPVLKNVLFLLGETNSLINPFVYSLYSKDIRTQLARLMNCEGKGQIKPYRSFGQVVAHFNIKNHSDSTSGRSMRQDSSEDQASDSAPGKSSADCRTVFSIS
ncbi:glucose-dependent insulinotropic receptor-like [Anolis carolinensis]|nr:PREDICTED: glucose-dependent insulinotropic receptor-like [Anolis carolinensis]|eukprot:XP_016847419.1 PREDICTED: glucose-dependent insulinotropic receptor-like [Anolis carolinensis]